MMPQLLNHGYHLTPFRLTSWVLKLDIEWQDVFWYLISARQFGQYQSLTPSPLQDWLFYVTVADLSLNNYITLLNYNDKCINVHIAAGKVGAIFLHFIYSFGW